jgi:hypothetical protein
MQTPSPSHVAQVILTAPAWARVGIAAPSEALRERAAQELALVIVERLDEPLPQQDTGQIALPL